MIKRVTRDGKSHRISSKITRLRPTILNTDQNLDFNHTLSKNVIDYGPSDGGNVLHHLGNAVCELMRDDDGHTDPSVGVVGLRN